MARFDAAGVSEFHARVCKALTDPNRLLIINELAEGPRAVGDVAGSLKIAQPTVSRHLGVLRDRGFVTAERLGGSVRYSLASPKILRAVDLLRQFMAEEAGSADPRSTQQCAGWTDGAAVSRADAIEIYELHARVCKAIADGKRLLIINELRDGPRTVGDLVAALGIGQANASQHLAILRERGVVAASRSGINVRYSLTSGKVVAAVDLLYEFMTERQGAGLIPLAG